MRSLACAWVAAACLAPAALRAEDAPATPPAPAAEEPKAPIAQVVREQLPPEPIGVKDFARFPFGTLPSLSPDGAQLAVVFRTDEGRALGVRSTAEDAPSTPRLLGTLRARPRWTQWTKHGRVIVAAERWQPRTEMGAMERPVDPPRPIFDRRGRVVGYMMPPIPPRKEMPAGRIRYLISFNAERGRGRILGKDWLDPVPVQDDVLSWLPSDPRRILIAYDEVERWVGQRVARPSVQAMSVATGGLRTVVSENRHVQRWFADHDGVVRLGEGDRPDGGVVLYRLDGRKLVEVPTYVNAIEASVRFAAYSYDPDVIYAWAPVRGRQALVTLRLSDSTVDGVFADDHFDVTGPLVFDETQRKLVGVGFVSDQPELHALDPTLADEREKMQRAVPGLALDYVSETDDKKLVLVRASSDVRAPAYYLYDRTAHTMRLELTEYPRLEGVPLQPMEPVRFFARDGLEIPAYLTRPQGVTGRAPAIVLVHDGPDERAYRRFDPLVQWLARSGFAVLEPNFRGSSGYGQALRSAGLGEWGGAMQDDLEDAAAWLVAQGIADVDRIGVYGRGYGGYAALMGVLREKSPFRAAASLGGPTDLPGLLEDDERERVEPDWSERVLGARKLKDKQLLELSPIHHVAQLDRPVLLLHAEHDERVRVEQSEQLAKLAQKAGKPVELVRLDDELYEPAKEATRLLWFDKLASFFQAQLAPRPAAPTAAPAAAAPAPSNATQESEP